MWLFDIFDFLFRRRKTSPATARLEAARRTLAQTTNPKMKAELERDIDEMFADEALEELIARDSQGAAIGAGRDQLRELNDALSGRPVSAISVLIMLQLAIEHGAPIYNRGSHIGCACLYDYAARIILRLIGAGPGAAGEVDGVARRFASVSFTPITAMAAKTRAWELRRAFDDILAMLTPEAAAAPAAPAAPPDIGRKAPPAPPEAGTRKRVFVSHAKLDAPAAENLVRALETEGISCWIAPRDIRLGFKFGTEIVDAIENTAVTLVLLSSRCNESPFVADEIRTAVNCGKRIIPIRLENIKLSRDIELFLGGRQWVDLIEGSPVWEENLRTLVASLGESSAAAG